MVSGWCAIRVGCVEAESEVLHGEEVEHGDDGVEYTHCRDGTDVLFLFVSVMFQKT